MGVMDHIFVTLQGIVEIIFSPAVLLQAALIDWHLIIKSMTIRFQSAVALAHIEADIWRTGEVRNR